MNDHSDPVVVLEGWDDVVFISHQDLNDLSEALVEAGIFMVEVFQALGELLAEILEEFNATDGTESTQWAEEDSKGNQDRSLQQNCGLFSARGCVEQGEKGRVR